MSKYPECDKWGKVHSVACSITEFIEWREYHYEGERMPPLQDQIYAYFDIDADKLEAERRAMIEALQA